MPTSCNTHDYDGELREKWFQIRPTLLDKYLPNCLSFERTVNDMEEWLERKYFNVKRIGRARRALKILVSNRRSNFDSCNEIDVEELLPILWYKVKGQEDMHDTFYEQLCDITGGSCSQGRSTRLFQFLFLFDLSAENVDSEAANHDSATASCIALETTEKNVLENVLNLKLETDAESVELMNQPEPGAAASSLKPLQIKLTREEDKSDDSIDNKSMNKKASDSVTDLMLVDLERRTTASVEQKLITEDKPLESEHEQKELPRCNETIELPCTEAESDSISVTARANCQISTTAESVCNNVPSEALVVDENATLKLGKEQQLSC